MVHHNGKEHQKEDETYLNEALFEGDAQVAPANSFYGKQQQVSAVKYGDGKKIQDAEIQADDRHQIDDVKSAFLHCLSGHVCDSNDALELRH